jgi:HSP20 family protein
MAPTLRGDPLLAELQSLGEDVDRMFGGMAANTAYRRWWLPPADVYETDDDVVIELDVPGLHPENLTVESVNGQLVITGERQPPENATRRYRAERWSGRFVRSFALQPRFSGEEVRAEYTDGVLTVRLRKPEEVKPRRISISRERRQISKKSS